MTGTSPPTIVFDLDGTLIDTAPDLLTTLNIVLGREGIAPVGREEIVGYIGSGARAMIGRAFSAAGRPLPPDKHAALFADYLAEYDRHLVDESAPYAGTEAMLDRFAAAGWLLAVCTNKFEAPARKLLDRLGLARRFAAITGQDTFGVSKPHPLHLTETIRAAGGVAERAVMVGDSHVDIETAKAAGIPVVAVSFGYSPVPVATLGPTVVIDSFDALYPVAVEFMRRPSRPAEREAARLP